jgi:hypothetical protein
MNSVGSYKHVAFRSRSSKDLDHTISRTPSAAMNDPSDASDRSDKFETDVEVDRGGVSPDADDCVASKLHQRLGRTHRLAATPVPVDSLRLLQRINSHLHRCQPTR